MTHTGRMTFPIRPGTARRLGIRPPLPQGVLIFGRALTDEEMARIRDACDQWVDRLHARIEIQPAPRRRWWQRRNR